MPVRYGKLVRDRIPEIIQAPGHQSVARVLDDATYQVALLAKLAEETREAQEAATEDLPAELADILEPIRALAAAVGMPWAQLLVLAAEKRTQRGGFEKRIFLEFVEPRHSHRRPRQAERLVLRDGAGLEAP
jgi:predicted house-cleaning noncanonical NTP pyrophosphatase (MazG superfamily)